MTVGGTSTAARRIGLLGGSFDPIHCGHIAAAEEAAERLSLERVILIPAGVPPHKAGGTRARAAERLAMADAAVRGHERLEVSEVEVRRSGTSYTVDTLRELRDRLGPEVELRLLLGTDAVRDLPSWRDVKGIFALATPVVIGRPGDASLDWDALERALPAVLLAPLRAGILALERGVQVSSTEIRGRIASGLPISGLVPEAVERYIEAHGLYRQRNP